MAPGRIDVHHHYVFDTYKNAVIASGGDPSGWVVPAWSVKDDEAFCKKYNVGTSMLSITAPGACILKGEDGAKLARACNVFAAELRDKDPSSYGILANLPNLIDKELALQEIAYAFDVLKADGVTLFTRYGPSSHYLGHPDFKDIWDELDRREAVVFIHPTHPADTTVINPYLPQPILEYPFETTKTAVDLIMSKRMRTHTKVKIILSHGGGALPYMVERPAAVLPCMSENFSFDDFVEDAKKFYYDTAICGSWNVLTILQKFAKPGHILFGSDYCYAAPGLLEHHIPGLDNFAFEDPKMLENINRNNALALFPRLAQYNK